MIRSDVQGRTAFRLLDALPRAAVVAIAYAVAAKVSFLVTISPGNISPIFPAAGIALAAVLIEGRPALLGIWLGAIVANGASLFAGPVASARGSSTALLLAGFVGIGATCGAGMGAWLVRRFCKNENPLHSGANVLILVLVGALGCGTISPTVGVLSLSLGGFVPWSAFGYSWLTWWLGDAAGIVVAAPLVLAWYHQRTFRMNFWRILEALALGGISLLICVVVFFLNMPFEYVLMPLLLWAAFRYGMRGASACAAAIAVFATIGASHGSSPLARNSVNDSLLLLHSFLGVATLCALFIAGILAERDRAGLALRASEERLRLLGDNLPDSYVYQYTHDANQVPRFLYLSAGLERLHGLKAQDVLRDASVLYAQIAPGQLDALVAAELASLESFADFEMELEMKGADGRWRWLQVCSRPRRDDDGRVVWDGVAIDITARKCAADALRDSERKYRELVEHANSIILRWNAEGRITFLNEFGQRFFGYSAEEICGRHVLDTIVPPTESGGRDLRQLMEEICANPAAFERNINENMCRNGERVWISWTNRIVRDSQDRIVEFLSVGTDVTERRRAEEARRESEARYRTLFECAPDGIVISDPEGRYLDANASMCGMLGYSRDELIGLHVSDIIVTAEVPHLEPALRATQALFERYREWQFRRKNGSVFPAEVIATTMPDGNLLGMIRNIADRKEAESEREQRHQAEAADRIKSAFLATMSHELRTPLNSIIGFTGIVLQGLAGPLNPEQSKQLEMVRTSARHLLALVNDVLDISKIEAGQFEVACEPFDIKRSLTKVVATIRPLAEKKRLALRVTVAPELGDAVSDERRFEQILLNLLSNAIKFTDQGEIALLADLVDDFKPPGAATGTAAVRMRVSDSGIGIKPDDLESLFQPFRQIDSGLSRNRDGTGLGLAICRRLAELMGGAIGAESTLGKGSTFSVTLPLKGTPRQ